MGAHTIINNKGNSYQRDTFDLTLVKTIYFTTLRLPIQVDWFPREQSADKVGNLPVSNFPICFVKPQMDNTVTR